MVLNVKNIVNIMRPGIYGNPFIIGPDGTREEVLQKFEKYFLDKVQGDPEFRALILKLKGKHLFCCCKPLPCHGDIIEKWLNENS